jgi:hypothetical protein
VGVMEQNVGVWQNVESLLILSHCQSHHAHCRTHVTSMEPESSSEGRVCFVVYAEASSALGAHKIFKNHDMDGKFVRMKSHFVPLAIYSNLISRALHGELAMLKNITTRINKMLQQARTRP